MPGLGSVPLSSTGVWLAVASMLIFSACTLISSVASRKLDSDCGALLAVAVNLVVGLLLTVAQLLAGRPMTTPSVWGIAAFVVAGIFSTYLGRWLFFKSIETLGPTRASAFMTCSPLITALISWLLLGEHLNGVGVAGMVLAVGGLLIMSQRRAKRQGAAHTSLQTGAHASLAIGAGSTIAYAVSHVFRGAGVREWNEPVIGATLGAAAGLLALAFVSRHALALTRARIAQQQASAWMFCGVGCMQVVAQVLMIASMSHIPIAVATLIASSTPLIVMPVTVFFMRNFEQVRLSTVLGVLATVAGVMLAAVFSGGR